MTTRPQRRVELVWRELKKSGFFASLLHRWTRGYVSGFGRTYISGFRARAYSEFLGLVRKDNYGYYVEGGSPTVAHWALRVEVRRSIVDIIFTLLIYLVSSIPGKHRNMKQNGGTMA
jgi:hypothetical protein